MSWKLENLFLNSISNKIEPQHLNFPEGACGLNLNYVVRSLQMQHKYLREEDESSSVKVD